MTGPVEVRAYDPGMAGSWNAFNARALNGHFLFDRGFMDYHADRFEDASLIVLRDSEPCALLPASRAGEAVSSHGGLTFGGLVVDALGASEVLEALDLCAAAWREAGARRLSYKAQPAIYPRRPAQADLYWLFLRGALLARRDLTAAIDYRDPGGFSQRRRRGARKAAAAGLVFEPSQDWDGYWPLLQAVLSGRHGATPVHSLPEIRLLAGRFPEAISLHLARRGPEVLAGVVMFVTPRVAHAQYIAVDEEGRAIGALDGLFAHLVGLFDDGWRRWFDFGISNTDGGRVLNEGLMRHKEEFGATPVVHDTYLLEL